MKIVQKFRELPVFWHHFLLMGVFLLFLAILMVASNVRTETQIRNFYTEEMQTKLDRGVTELERDLKEPENIPNSLRDTKTFEYILSSEAGKPVYWYSALLTMLKRSLNKQLYLQKNAENTIIYVPKIDAAVSRTDVILDGGKLFSEHVIFSETPEADLWKALATPETTAFIPVQEITINSSVTRRIMAMAAASFDREAGMSIMSLFTEETLLDYFGYRQLPEGSVLRIFCGENKILECPDEERTPDKTAICLNSTSSGVLSAELLVPEDYFENLMAPYQRTSAELLILFLVLGIILCLVLSENFTQPVRLLADRALKDGDALKDNRRNEFRRIESMMVRSDEQAKEMENRLRDMLFTKLFSGAMLMTGDEGKLREMFGGFWKRYRIAVFHTDTETNEVLSRILLGGEDSEDFCCAMTGTNETTLLFKESKENLELLIRSVQVLNKYFKEEKEIRLGISGVAEDFEDSMSALRQACAALPSEPGYRVAEKNIEEHNEDTGWIQEEHLYQTILSKDREAALKLIQKIAEGVHSHTEGRELYYSTQRVLRSALGELGAVPDFAVDGMYAEGRSPKANILGLQETLINLFELLQKAQKEKKETWGQVVVDWTVAKACLPDLTVTLIAEEFKVSEKKIYEVIREETGKSPYNIILDTRMKVAARLLLTTSCTVGEVTERCGYTAESTFYRVFKKYYGKTPLEYRNESGILENGQDLQ